MGSKVGVSVSHIVLEDSQRDVKMNRSTPGVGLVVGRQCVALDNG